MSLPEASPQVPRPPFPLGRLVAYLSIVVFILIVYIVIAEFVYPPLVDRLIRQFVTNVTQADVSRVPHVNLTLRGGLLLKNAEVVTSKDGDHRPFYRAEEMELVFDVNPLLRKDVKLRRIELKKPEIYLVRAPNGVWNLQWVFQPKVQPHLIPPPVQEPRIAPPPPVRHDAFPLEGIHVQDGTIHFVFVNEQRREMRWRVENVNFGVTREEGRFRISRISGNFYGGRMMVDVDVPKIDPLDVNATFNLVDARVEELVKEGPEATKNVRGVMRGTLVVTSNPKETEGKMTAHGILEIKNGSLWEFPVFYSILNVLSLELPGNARIDESRLEFAVERTRVNIKTMNFLGYPVSLFGDGSMDLHGENLDMTFVPRLGKAGLEGIPLLGTPTQALLDIVKGTLVPVSVTGSFYKPEVSLTPLKPITQPVKDLINIFAGKD